MMFLVNFGKLLAIIFSGVLPYSLPVSVASVTCFRQCDCPSRLTKSYLYICSLSSSVSFKFFFLK